MRLVNCMSGASYHRNCEGTSQFQILCKFCLLVCCLWFVASSVNQRLRVDHAIPLLNKSLGQESGICMSDEARLIKTISETIDTRTTLPFLGKNCAKGKRKNSAVTKQFYVQTVEFLAPARRKQLETVLGIDFGRYVPNNAYIVNMNCSTAALALQHSDLLWVGIRPYRHKIDPSLEDGRTESQGGPWPSTTVAIFVTVMPMMLPKSSIQDVGGSLSTRLQREARIATEWRPASDSKLTLELRANQAAIAARWLARQPEVVWIEAKAAFASRNAASARVLVSGTSELSRRAAEVETRLYGLTGVGQTVALADTGIDWDHCMLWNPPFPFPCFDPAVYRMYDPDTMSPDIACPPSAFAALLAEKDFLAFVRMMNQAASADDAAPETSLLGSGTTVGVASRPPPLNLVFPNRTRRRELGLRFPPDGDASFDELLAAWSDFRPTLLNVLTPVLLLALCADCGGRTESREGLTVFIPDKQYKYAWGAVDTTADLMLRQDAARYRTLSLRLFQKCMCFFATPSPTTVDPAKSWMGPVPPALEMLELAYSPYAQVTRKLLGLPALSAELLGGMCNASRRNLTDVCAQNITFLWGDTLEQLNPCELTWNPRLLEVAVATCVSERYIPRTRLTAESALRATRAERNRLYAYNTTVEWWREYTRVPPFDRVDRSRSLSAYYTYGGCAPCGACDRLLADSRDYAGAEAAPALPVAKLARGSLVLLRMRPLDGDWLRDAFQFRSTAMHMRVSVTAEFNLAAYPPSTLTNLSSRVGLAVCVTTLQPVPSDPAEYGAEAWLARCLHRFTVQPALYAPVQRRTAVVGPLLPSADGWQVLLFHNEVEPMDVDAQVQLYASATACSDKGDGESFLAQSTRAVNFSGTDVASLAPDGECQSKQIAYCDGSVTSGRQLDLCRVCGGACFSPNCSAALCPQARQNGIAGVRFAAEYAQWGGFANRTFNLSPRLAIAMACNELSLSGVDCRPIGCNRLGLCSGRLETYRVDTRGATVRAGEDFVFGAGSLLYDIPNTVSAFRQLVRLTLFLSRPSLLSWFPDGFVDSDIGEIRLPPVFFRTNGSNATGLNASNFSFANNVSVVSMARTRVELDGFGEDIFPLLAGLTYRPTVTAGTNFSTRLVSLSFQLSILAPDGRPYSRAAGRFSPYILKCSLDRKCICVDGFTGESCDVMFNTKQIIFTVQPQDPWRRIIPNSPPRPGRMGIVNRGGHGTHVATSLVGMATAGDNSPSDSGLLEIKGFEPISNGAKLAFVDIGTDASPYLTPPESLGDALLGRAYREAGARVFVAPWTCESFQWWGRVSNSTPSSSNSTNGNATNNVRNDKVSGNDDSTSVPTNPSLGSASNLCNRYSSSAWEIDEFVQRNPDLLVIFPAGDSGAAGPNTISSPGTCKNCLTVGMSQLWAESLRSAAPYVPGRCLPDDCPQTVDQSTSCGGSNSTSPYYTPDCCTAKYVSNNFRPETVHFTSGRGLAVSSQSKQAIYADRASVRFGRVKPEIVAPGTLIVSGRSDGNPASGGTHGCRCCGANADGDTSCLVAMSGSSMSAAQVGAAAVLVRQYFTDGWYPQGYTQGPESAFAPSAALLRAVLVTTADPMLGAARSDGSREDISTMRTPNLYAGFGRATLTKALRLVVPFNDVCPCSGDNTGLFSSDSDPSIQRFGRDYGTRCAPWHNMPDGRPQRCENMFSDSKYTRPVPEGFNPSVNDISCCLSWCFVSPSCTNVPGSGTRNWTSVSGLTYSFVTCQNQPDSFSADKCPWADASRNYDIRTIVKDHSILDNATETASGTNLVWEKTPTSVQIVPNNFPISAAIAQNETFFYNASIYGASSMNPLIVTLAYTDPSGSLGSADVMVNNLDLRILVTPLGGKLFPNATIGQAMQIPRLYNQTVQYWGNGVPNGDPFNNVEQVRLTAAGPSEVIVSVVASRIVQGLKLDSPCQPFSLVWTGQLVGFPEPPPLSSDPINLIPGICGRPPPLTLQVETGFSASILGLIIACSIVGMGCLIIGCYILRRARVKIAQAAADNKDKPDQMGYLTSLKQTLREEGLARGGAMDHVLLCFDSSPEDDFYRGLPIAIVDGAGAGEVAVITKYEGGSSRKAYAAFSVCAPEKGSRYIIAHEHGTGLGYKVSTLGYAAPDNTPQRLDGYGNSFYGRQMTALSHARATHGQLAPNDLARSGIGRAERERSIAQDLNALNAGMLVGREFSSGDIFTGGLAASEVSYNPMKEAQKRVRQNYFDGVESRTKTNDASASGRLDRSFVPPLKNSVLPSGVGRVRGPDGYTYSRTGHTNGSGGFPVEEELHV